ncbi:hypothetical protein [Frigidibacter mobilis]|uniref:Uncharacterized protein n=1 Tax=Frigidibacter mobilis TaxID=1335048 RepID=A0A159Z0D2_9RHOB|nr:hypothetical protein [Frigidibacter mobilis]AMY68227.1 hypothetical protein AKL17_0968 [Frigidibacter mobilis]
MKPQPRWMASVLAETARAAANPTPLPWQRKAGPVRAPRAAAAPPFRAAART